MPGAAAPSKLPGKLSICSLQLWCIVAKLQCRIVINRGPCLLMDQDATW